MIATKILRLNDQITLNFGSSFLGTRVDSSSKDLIKKFLEDKGAVVNISQKGDIQISRGWLLTFRNLEVTQAEWDEFMNKQTTTPSEKLAALPAMLFSRANASTIASNFWKTVQENKVPLVFGVTSFVAGAATFAIAIKFKVRS